eukprot:TRINITY_DN789_c0_g1_i1.p1 TRINITY_DN789_c0_g1~~TRINITY_DN789_c0_g1_i1.p1  ORF type:complete len:281 (-),score=52.38 TRINITY_DN789_c0_g1_i1:399-1220(-)
MATRSPRLSRPLAWFVLGRFLLAALLLLSAVVIAESSVDKGQDDSKATAEETGLISEGSADVFDDLGPASGVDTVVYWPKKPDGSIVAGDPTTIVVGINNNGDEILKISFIHASLLPPFDQRYFLQNFTTQELGDVELPRGIQASFQYSFTVNKLLQSGSYVLAGTVYYLVGDQVHRTVFYNGTVDVAEASGMFSGETLFLFTLGAGLLGLLGMWVYGQAQKLSKKSRRPKKVETGTRSAPADVANNEWLQNTAFTAKAPKSIAQQTKSKKKK